MADWHILTIEPRREFTVAASLAGSGVTIYLPTYQVRVGAGRLTRLIDRPLFPGYLFARMASGASWRAVHSAAGYSGYLRCGEYPATLSEAAIVLVRKVEEEMAAKAKVRESRFQRGDEVVIDEDKNPWMGLHGIVEKLDKTDRVIIEIIEHGNSWRISVPVDCLKTA